MNKQRKSVDVAIVGAGLTGAALALWLLKHTRLSIAVLERNEPMAIPNVTNQRVVALGKLATDFLADINVLNDLDKSQCHPYSSMRVWDEHSDGLLEFDCKSLKQNQLGHMVDSLACSYALQQRLLAEQKKENTRIECFFSSELKKMNWYKDGAQLEYLHGDCNADAPHFLSAHLFVAADGGRSWLRQQAKIFANHHSYQQFGIVAKIRTSLAHQECAWQRFLNSGPVAVLPLANNESSIVWSADDALAEQLMSLSAAEFEVRLEHALQSKLGTVSLLSKRQAFPLNSQSAERYFTNNVALIGDAAHSIHPLAGQGANLGFKDALALGQCLQDAEQQLANNKFKKISMIGQPRFLQHYQRKRLSDNQQTDALMSALHLSFQNQSPIWMMARGMGMNVLNKTSMLRQLLAKQAMGL